MTSSDVTPAPPSPGATPASAAPSGAASTGAASSGAASASVAPSGAASSGAASSGRADANRRRIEQVALAELLRDPDVSMDQIARAAGVVRRTVYGHFPSREALIAALVDSAVESVAQAHAAGRDGVDDPAEAVARATLNAWRVADRYRLLVALAQRSVTMEGIRQRLAPVRRSCADLLQRGLDEGVFSSPLPAAALAYVHEQVLFGLMEAVNAGTLPPGKAGRSAAVTVLISAGVPPERATELVAGLVE